MNDLIKGFLGKLQRTQLDIGVGEPGTEDDGSMEPMEGDTSVDLLGESKSFDEREKRVKEGFGDVLRRNGGSYYWH